MSDPILDAMALVFALSIVAAIPIAVWFVLRKR